ncbi:reprolysin-like metallopeptidase [Allomuricauda sp. SCSIO 65647]|uniref:reprolysin-like metallopeptidase n=1 Tax=Allomuricauda sp. SCSIO 65647 TaxID=2908843 RepID=UPI001F1FE8DE|nr:zinc-dependent metalloprotease family protein [Muricauda sp. SCSIO 65647]UJH69258.1 M12 family metallo-peptidase [Muricauda sp. SCSIO 65647]
MFLGWFSLSAQDGYWKLLPPQSAKSTVVKHDDELKNAHYFSLDEAMFAKTLHATDQISIEVFYPLEDGSLGRFQLRETPVFHEELARKYPSIKSYTGINADGTARLRLSFSHKGVQGMCVDLQTRSISFLQKLGGSKNTYLAYQRDKEALRDDSFVCNTMPMARDMGNFPNVLVDDQTLRKFRIAVSATGEYTDYHGGTVVDALAAINATLTRVNEVFETDLAVTLELVPSNDQVIFTDAETDPYNGGLNAQVQNTLTTIIGEANYDVGHLFHKDNDNGNAGFIGSVCVDNRKGSAFASAETPEGDNFDLDYVAHELGHQFGANHTWSFESEGSDVQAEPASGTSIMGYAGIVGDNNVAPNGDDYFHYYSIVQIIDYLQTANCAETTVLTNAPPTVAPLQNYTIPKSTAFVLTANATDSDSGDVLTYTWEQIDSGVVTTETFGPENPSGANFRSLPPTTDPERYFPRLSEVAQGNLTQTDPPLNSAWETVSEIQRDLNFALTVRDNAAGGGQVVTATTSVSVINAAGPFEVLSQATGELYAAGSVQTVTWSVANTDVEPINAEKVDIFLSVDGGSSFPIQIADDVLNDGSAEVLLPSTGTDMARIMVKASDNIFFAVNSANFTIQEAQVVLDFESLEVETCQPNDLITSFVYDTSGGFNEVSTFTADAPTGLDVSFSPSTATADDTNVQVTFSNTGAVTEGNYPVTITSTAASVTQEVVLQVNLYDGTFEEVVLLEPMDFAVDTPVNPLFTWQDSPAHTSYDIEIATDVAFTDIVEAATISFNKYRSALLQPETVYYWRVKPKNGCGEGPFGTPFGFTTTLVDCESRDADDLPLEIRSDEATTISSSITILEDLSVADVNVSLELNHTFLEDLVINLISPSGTKVALVSKSCGNMNNINAVFDDDGNDISCGGDPAISGVVKPLGELASFAGESSLGTWVLEIEDTASSDGGSLQSFSLEICAEGTFRPDEDEDGVFDDGDDLCLGTPKGAEVDTSGCQVHRFATDNFTLQIQSESCRSNNDASISISAIDTSIDYTAVLSGNGLSDTANFNDTHDFQNLQAGDYTLCITGTIDTKVYQEQCFDLMVDEPDVLSVSSKLLIDARQVSLTLGGAVFYNVEVNGIVTQTTENELLIGLKKGLNTLKISSALPCQGIYEETFVVGTAPIVFPNPTRNNISVYYDAGNLPYEIKVFASDGQLVRNQSVNGENLQVDVTLSGLPSGVYYLEVSAKGYRQTQKVIKR